MILVKLFSLPVSLGLKDSFVACDCVVSKTHSFVFDYNSFNCLMDLEKRICLAAFIIHIC